jgi:predicted nucleic acid-binding protein
VLQEFYVNVTRKIPNPLSPASARDVINDYLSWQVVTNTPEIILLASEIQERNMLSFWDALIIAAARQGGAKTILTEDLNHGQLIEDIRIENPFLTP